MRATRSLPTTLTVLVLALATLSGCSDGEVDGERSDATPGASASEPTEPSTAEYVEAHALFHDLAAVIDGAGTRAASYQQSLGALQDQDPQAFLDDPQVAAAQAEQRAAAEERDAAVAALAGHPAMADEELATAYRTFAGEYAVAMAYQDGYHESLPILLASNDTRPAILDVEPGPTGSVADYARQWLRLHDRAATPCLELNLELAASTNEDVAAIAGLWQGFIERRTAIFARLLRGRRPRTPPRWR